jgi:hypothetical protein
MQLIARQSLDRVLDDIRQLRREKEGLPPCDTVTLSCHADDRAEHHDVAERPKASCAPNALRETVAHGLLTGRFPTADAEQSSSELDMLAPSELATPPVATEANFGAATRLFASKMRRAEARIGISNRPI